MTALILTRGLPGSGKTTETMKLLAAHPGMIRLNRDALRESLYGRAGVLEHAAEQSITLIQQTAARDALSAGRDVIVDDLNLRAKYARAWADLAVECGADLQTLDLTWVPVETCIDRDAARGATGGRMVGEKVIRDLHAKFLASGGLAPITPTPATETSAAEPYVKPFAEAPPAWLVDVDGTLALMDGRGPFEWHRVGEDQPNLPVIEMIRALHTAGTEEWENTIIVMSGRDEICRPETEAWLKRNRVPYDLIFMRSAGDMRKDALVKAELFDRHVRPVFDVRGVIDDRRQVVDFWRSVGLMCAQVAPGNF